MVGQAIMLVPEFENVVRKLEQQFVLRGQSKGNSLPHQPFLNSVLC
jgi:hypothetical protein